jgi:hypothetical protein
MSVNVKRFIATVGISVFLIYLLLNAFTPVASAIILMLIAFWQVISWVSTGVDKHIKEGDQNGS